ncbi:MAG: type II secretion system protein [Phycisphaerae bacterium]|nr:type II secretion system protein [Phycisphaerae bacterium]
MTMIEMLVAVAILSFIILAFGTILTQTQKVIKTSQTSMRTNGTASAIAKVIRNDLKQLTQNGFLCITQTKGDNSIPRLLFTTAGTTYSKTNNVTGQYGIPMYGTIANQLGTNSSYASLTSPSCLVRQKWVLDPTSTSSGDVWGGGVDMTYIGNLPVDDLSNDFIGTADNTPNSLLNAFPKETPPTDGLYVPPRNQDDLSKLWQVLSNETSRLSVMWTDGDTTGGVLNWYGLYYNDVDSDGSSPTGRKQIPRDSTWDNKTIADVIITPSICEFRIPYPTDSTNNYRALWTKDTPSWPKAIKISFVLYDQAMAEDMQAKSKDTPVAQGIEARRRRYEIICPIGR